MPKFKLLDCTLRDGGYINNWFFGKQLIDSLICALDCANIDCIEYGFLNDSVQTSEDSTLYNDVNNVRIKSPSHLPALMVNFGEYDFNKSLNNFNNIEIRIAFKPYDISKIPDYVKLLKENRIIFSLNPMHISLYNEKELANLCKITNELAPSTLTCVDTMGIMSKDETYSIFNFLDSHVDRKISFGFHSHDNLNLSLENVKNLIDLNLDRTIIFDSCLGGISRGGGILKTEEIAEYLNKYYGYEYNLDKLYYLKKVLLTDLINKYNQEDRKLYYLSAKNSCHPNYSKFLNAKNISIDKIDKILRLIPNVNKPYYSEQVIEELLNNSLALLF